MNFWEWATLRARLLTEFSWPPEWPRRRSILEFAAPASPASPRPENRDEWGAHDWQSYAQFLEERGASIVKELVATKLELATAKKRLSRKKIAPTKRNSSILAQGGRKRKNASNVSQDVADVRQIQNQSPGLSNRKALQVWISVNFPGDTIERHRRILNAMSLRHKKT